jgi:hypothetical protein
MARHRGPDGSWVWVWRRTDAQLTAAPNAFIAAEAPGYNCHLAGNCGFFSIEGDMCAVIPALNLERTEACPHAHGPPVSGR